MEILDKRNSIKQPICTMYFVCNNMYFVEKIKKYQVENEQKEFLVKWQTFHIRESTWKSEENNSHKEIIESYFKEISDLGASYDTNVCAMFNLADTMTAVQMHFEVAKCFINPCSIVKKTGPRNSMIVFHLHCLNQRMSQTKLGPFYTTHIHY